MTVTVFKVEQIGTFFDREDGSKNGIVTYIAHTDDLLTTQETILADPRCPQRQLSGHPQNPTIECRSRRIDTLGDYVYRVTATFDNQRQTKEDNDDATVALIKGGQRAYTELRPVFFDAFGAPLVNAAGDFYEGQMKRHRMRQFNVTANFGSLAAAQFLFQYAGSVNANAVTILGETFPAGTCSLGEVQHPEEPFQDNNGVEYWPMVYDITVDPDGWFIMLPNRGPNEIVYQTRASTNDDFEDDTYANYQAETDNDLKKRIKRRIRTDEGQDVGSDIWLNPYGESEKLLGLTPQTLSVSLTANSNAATVAGLNSDHLGVNLVVPGAGPFQRPLRCRIDSVAGTTAQLSATASHSVTNVTAYTSGATVVYFLIDDVLNWSSIPLPNNQP